LAAESAGTTEAYSKGRKKCRRAGGERAVQLKLDLFVNFAQFVLRPIQIGKSARPARESIHHRRGGPNSSDGHFSEYGAFPIGVVGGGTGRRETHFSKKHLASKSRRRSTTTPAWPDSFNISLTRRLPGR